MRSIRICRTRSGSRSMRSSLTASLRMPSSTRPTAFTRRPRASISSSRTSCPPLRHFSTPSRSRFAERQPTITLILNATHGGFRTVKALASQSHATQVQNETSVIRHRELFRGLRHDWRRQTQASGVPTMPRLFTGLEIPAEIGQTLSGLRGGLPGARWIDPENYHVTLRFIGDIDGISANEIASMLFRVNRKPFEVKLQGLTSFGGRKPRAVVATVEPSRPLIELQAELERMMQRIGLDPEGRKFTPHVTLARLHDASSQDVADYLSVRGYFPSRVFTADRFVLFSARASTGGGPYVVEDSYALSP